MYIKEVILEGFKSYAQRTVISGFDPQFNAITGYNGSGKSNILDGICFVLGLSSLTLVRASSLQELIYKYGHAGITKASVSIVFDNTNKKNSPSGLEACDIIIVTRVIQSGKSKYYLNGRNVTNMKVKNMFKSIQLNIDNPHFLVAQGRITKAINLKPTELIGMIEETAGTSLYEQKRKESRKLMEKKEFKLMGVTEMLRDDIEPKMQKMRKEREQYYKWKAGESQLDMLEKYLTANEYYLQKKDVESLHLDRTNNEFAKKEIINKLANVEERIKAALKEIEEGEAQMNSEESIRYKELKAEVRAKKKEISTLESEIRNLERSIKDSEKEMDKRELEIAELESAVTRADHKAVYLDSTIQRQTAIYEEKRDLFHKNARQMDAVRKGDRTVEDELDSRLGAAELNLADVNSEIKKRETQKQHLLQELEKYKKGTQMSQEEHKKVEREIKALSEKVEIMRRQIEEFELITSNEDYLNVQDQMRMHFELINQMNLKLNQIIANNPDFKLSYRDPEPNFDRKKVRGRIFQLFSISDPGFIKALEAIAGGRLFNIVVDNEHTSKLLLGKRCFGNNSVVLIPNEKIIPFTIPDDAVLKARKIAAELNGQAVPAISIIKFDPELKNSLEYVFGGTFICSSSEIAQRVAFDPKIRRRCVNLEGDIFDPSGTLTGGFQNMNRSILTRYAEYKRTLEEYEKKRIKAKELEALQAEYKKKMDRHNELKTEYDISAHRLSLMEKQIREISQARLKEKTESVEMELKDINQQLAELREQQRSLLKEVQEFRDEKASVTKGNRDIMEVLKQQSERLKREVDKLQVDLKKLKAERSTLEVEREQNKNEIKRKKKAVQDELANSKKLKRNLEKCTKELENSREYYYKIEEEKRDLDKVFSQLEAKMAQAEIELEKLEKESNNLDRELKRVNTNIENINRDIRENERLLEHMVNEAPWLVKEADKFGIPGGEYDFDNSDIEFEKKKYENLKKEQEMLVKRINLQVESICDKLDNEYIALIRRRTILETDRNTINKNIDELDKKRSESISDCVTAVNKHFREIFATFLPGTGAKLLPVNEEDLSEGLEIKVSFSGIWKVGLSELSGGQRSLLALSFLLALLRYQPAPFYILDEIDAALDLSHTENIGEMIMSHFPQSQFIIISLKEEFYNKANVVFQTSVVHGVSRVERIANVNPTVKKRAIAAMLENYYDKGGKKAEVKPKKKEKQKDEDYTVDSPLESPKMDEEKPRRSLRLRKARAIEAQQLAYGQPQEREYGEINVEIHDAVHAENIDREEDEYPQEPEVEIDGSEEQEEMEREEVESSSSSESESEANSEKSRKAREAKRLADEAKRRAGTRKYLFEKYKTMDTAATQPIEESIPPTQIIPEETRVEEEKTEEVEKNQEEEDEEPEEQEQLPDSPKEIERESEEEHEGEGVSEAQAQDEEKELQEDNEQEKKDNEQERDREQNLEPQESPKDQEDEEEEDSEGDNGNEVDESGIAQRYIDRKRRLRKRVTATQDEGPTQLIDEDPFQPTQEIEYDKSKDNEADFGATQLIDNDNIPSAGDYEQTQAIDEEQYY